MEQRRSKQQVNLISPNASYLYKYSGFCGERQNWLKDIILGNRLYLPTLPELNDPADGRPRLRRQSESQLFSFLYNSRYGVLSRNPHLGVEAQIREAVVLHANISRLGADCINRELHKCFSTYMERYRIYSLSKRYNNMNLWANYADQHRGYCLEFARTGSFFERAKEVVYGDKPETDISNDDDLKAYWFLCKTDDWRIEEEIRVVVLPCEESTVSIEPNWLTRVILGCRMPDAHRAQIRSWAKERNPELNVVSAYFDEFEQSLRLSMSD